MSAVKELASERHDIEPPKSRDNLKDSQLKVLDVLIGARRRGDGPMSDADIRDALERIHVPKRYEKSDVACRISELIARGVVVVSREPKFDPKTRRNVRASYVTDQVARVLG